MGSWLSTPWDPSSEIPDLTGKVAIVTGAKIESAGIGYATTFELAKHGAKVYLASRSEAKALAAIEKMHAESPEIRPGNLIWLPLDLMDLDSVVRAAKTFHDQEDELDILVNNAGVATYEYQTTPAGFEVAMGVKYGSLRWCALNLRNTDENALSHLAHFLFTMRLLPVLKRTTEKKDSDVRIVNVSSSGHTMLIPKTIRFNKQSDFRYHGTSSNPPYASTKDLFSRYALSKLANILFTAALQQRYQNITCSSCNPGGTNTAGGMSVWPTFLRPIMSRLFVPAAVGAKPVLLLAAGKNVATERDIYKGVYVGSKCKIEMPSKMARDMGLAENLWAASDEALAKWIKE